MNNNSKRLTNPYSAGGGGPRFKSCVQAMHLTQMLTQGPAPCLPPWPIKAIKLQTRSDGAELDDMMVIAQKPTGSEQCTLFFPFHGLAIGANHTQLIQFVLDARIE